MRKSNSLYVWLVMFWLLLSAFFLPAIWQEYSYARDIDSLVFKILLTTNALFIVYFWLNGTKDLFYVLWYYLRRKWLHDYVGCVQLSSTIADAKVLLLYCTCDDFVPDSLRACLAQTHGNCEFVILDDSGRDENKAKVDAFARRYGIEVVRRANRRGFKAGNINNYLMARHDYDYFVLLDSDEIVPTTFCVEALRYFTYYRNVGIVQATHIATRNYNGFMDLLHVGVDSHWPVYQLVKHSHGFLSLLGHGAMVSRECYESAGGFPEFVAEDLCLSIAARNAGYMVAFAPNIICEEQFPVDYLAFRKRHVKWTQGNFEFISQFTGVIMRSRMSWYEKLDIVLFTYNLPLTVVFAFYIVLNVVLFPLFGYELHYPAWLIVPTVVFFFAPTMNDWIFWWRRLRLGHLLLYMFWTFVLYGSMLYPSMKSSFFSFLGKRAVFLVTPKERSRVSLGESIRSNRENVLYALVVLLISLLLKRSILPVALITFPAVMSVFLTRFSNVEHLGQVPDLNAIPKHLFRGSFSELPAGGDRASHLATAQDVREQYVASFDQESSSHWINPLLLLSSSECHSIATLVRDEQACFIEQRRPLRASLIGRNGAVFVPVVGEFVSRYCQQRSLNDGNLPGAGGSVG